MRIKFSIFNTGILILILSLIGFIGYIIFSYFYITPQLKKQLDNILYSNGLEDIISYRKIRYSPLINEIRIKDINSPFLSIKDIIIFKDKKDIRLNIEEAGINLLKLAKENFSKNGEQDLDLNDFATQMVILGYNNLKFSIDLKIKEDTQKKEISILDCNILLKDIGNLKLKSQILSEKKDKNLILSQGFLKVIFNISNHNMDILSQTKLDNFTFKDIFLAYREEGFINRLKNFNNIETLKVPSIEQSDNNKIGLEKEIIKFLNHYKINHYFSQEQISQLRDFWLNGGKVYLNIAAKIGINLDFIVNNFNNLELLIPYFYQSGAALDCQAK